MLRRQAAAFRVLCSLGHASASRKAMGGRPRDPARMFEGRRLCGVEVAGGRAGKAIGPDAAIAGGLIVNRHPIGTPDLHPKGTPLSDGSGR